MRKLGKVLPLIVLVIGGAYAWYRIEHPTYTYRYRLSIAADVGSETKTASSVIEVRIATQALPGIFFPVDVHVYGDAPFLDMGHGRNVFVLLACNPDGTEDCIADLVPRQFEIPGGLENLSKLEDLHGTRELTGKRVPALVTFLNLSDPKSARVVIPDQFEGVFGPDVHFKRLWIEMTDAQVTRGVERNLPWWKGPDRPAAQAYRAWRQGNTAGPSVEPERLFVMR